MIPNEMAHVHFDAPGGPEVLKIVRGPVPKPGPSDVLIRVAAAGVNRPEILQRKGAYPPPPGASPILGLEVSGTIAQVGAQVRQWKLGDRVCALVSGGGYAEFCLAPEVQCLPVPQGMDMESAAGIPETFFTVWSNVFMRGRLKAWESILIHGGTSGIGTVAIQLARAFGARVFTTAGSSAKCAAAVALGAEVAINYREQDFLAEIRKVAPKGVDVILDMVAGNYFDKNVDLLAPEGRLVQIATQQGEKVSLSLRTLMGKGGSITGSTLRPRTVAQKGEIATELLKNVWPLFAGATSPKIKVIVDRAFPMEQVVEAHRRMESSEHIGKIILKCSEQ